MYVHFLYAGGEKALGVSLGKGFEKECTVVFRSPYWKILLWWHEATGTDRL